jgi:hypothetical protein
MPAEIRLKPAASRATNPDVTTRIRALAELKFSQHGRMAGSYTDFPPKPDFVVAALTELADLLNGPK